MKTGCKEFEIKSLESPFHLMHYIYNTNSNNNETNTRPSTTSNIEEEPKFRFSNFLRICINTGYYALVIPFRINADGTIQKNKFQRVICAIGNFLAMYRYFTELRKFPFQFLNRNPVDYFLVFQKFSSISSRAILVKNFWMDEEKFQKLTLFCSNVENLTPINNWMSSKITISFICIIYLLMGLGTHLFGIRITNDLSYKDPEWFYRRYVAEARYAFFMSSEVNSTSAPFLDEISLSDQICTGILFFGNYCRCLVGNYWDCVILMGCLTLWLPSKAFARDIQRQLLSSEKPTNWADDIRAATSIMQKYKALKQLALLINETFQWFMLGFFTETVLYYSIYISAIFTASAWFHQIRIGVMLFGVIVIFTTASDVCKQIEKMRSYLSHEDTCKYISQFKVTVLLDELSTLPIGISGGVFTVTYSMMGMIISTLVTYFIICTQVNGSF